MELEIGDVGIDCDNDIVVMYGDKDYRWWCNGLDGGQWVICDGGTIDDKLGAESLTAEQWKALPYIAVLTLCAKHDLDPADVILERQSTGEPLKPLRVYVAGHYRAETKWKIFENIRKAETVGLEICRLGHYAVVPHVMYSSYEGELTDEFFVAATMAEMETCNAVVLSDCVNYHGSEGTVREIERAAEMEIPVYATVRDFRLANIDKPSDG